jgi:HPt (histidine-containing phosphotransfer) domain-containing protein
VSQIDIEAFKSHYGEDIDIVADLVEIFEVSYPETLADIEKAISSNNYKDLELHAHTLKGMCANFFCEELKNASLDLEKMGKDANSEGYESHLEVLKTNLPKLIEELKTIE